MKKEIPVVRFGWLTTAGRYLYAYGRTEGEACMRIFRYLCDGEDFVSREVDADRPWPVTMQDGRAAPGG